MRDSRNGMWFYLGVGLYVASFFLNAVNDIPGWRCALATLSDFPNLFRELYFYSGLVNPLVIGFVVVKLLDEAPRLRRVLALVALLLMVPTWIIVSMMAIKLGCALWVVSLFIVTAEDLGTWRFRPS